MKKKFAIIYFIVLGVIVLTVLYSEYASQYPYQPTRSTQILAVIKKAVPKSANKSIDKNNVIVTKKAVNSSSQTQQIEESETVIEDAKKEEKTSPSLEKSVTEINSTDNKINSKQQVQEILPTQERFAEMNLANGVNFDERLEEEKKYKTDSVSEMKTQGHYIGLDVVGNKVTFYEKGAKNIKNIPTSFTVKQVSSNYGCGMGINYKYAFNFNNIFIDQSIFVEKIGTKVNPNQDAYKNPQNGELDIRSRYGIFANIGYDVNSVLSPYLVVGYSMVSYKTENGYYRYNLGLRQSNIEKSTTGSMLYGLVLKANYSDKVSFNIEYNTQEFKAKTNLDVPINNKRANSWYQTRIETIKIGTAYKF